MSLGLVAIPDDDDDDDGDGDGVPSLLAVVRYSLLPSSSYPHTRPPPPRTAPPTAAGVAIVANAKFGTAAGSY